MPICTIMYCVLCILSVPPSCFLIFHFQYFACMGILPILHVWAHFKFPFSRSSTALNHGSQLGCSLWVHYQLSHQMPTTEGCFLLLSRALTLGQKYRRYGYRLGGSFLTNIITYPNSMHMTNCAYCPGSGLGAEEKYLLAWMHYYNMSTLVYMLRISLRVVCTNKGALQAKKSHTQPCTGSITRFIIDFWEVYMRL